jgi:hypothetical protein
VKCTNEEFNRFWDEVLGHDWYDDGDDVDFEDPTALIVLEHSCPRWQGEGDRPEPKGIITQRDIDHDCIMNVTSLFTRWRNAQMTTTFVVTFNVPNDECTAFLTKISDMKGVVAK